MAQLRVGHTTFDAGLVAFDKDGTLLDFETMWGGLLRALVAALASNADDPERLAAALYQDIGYDAAARRVEPDGPWAMATTEQVLTIMAATLYHHGWPYMQAEDAVHSAWRQITEPGVLADLVQPTADVVSLLSALKTAGVRVAVLTTDEWQATELALRVLGIDRLVDSVYCSDDPLPGKPAPDQLLAACQRWGVEAARAAVVGDTVFDLLMGRRAGAGLVVGVLSGAGDHDTLVPHADLVVASVGDIRVVSEGGEG
jgi:phosphoglycolate phosphatase